MTLIIWLATHIIMLILYRILRVIRPLCPPTFIRYSLPYEKHTVSWINVLIKVSLIPWQFCDQSLGNLVIKSRSFSLSRLIDLSFYGLSTFVGYFKPKIHLDFKNEIILTHGYNTSYLIHSRGWRGGLIHFLMFFERNWIKEQVTWRWLWSSKQGKREEPME